MKFFFQMLVLLLPASLLGAQAPRDSLAPRAQTRLFVECGRCDANYMREQLRFVDLVRDPLLADVHVLVTSLGTGSGGEAYTIETIGRRPPTRRDTTTLSLRADATSIEVRNQLARAVKLAIVPFLEESVLARLDVTYTAPSQTEVPRPRVDPWKQWVFRVSASGDVQSDENYGTVGIRSGLGASRVTSAMKLTVTMNSDYSRSRYTLQDSSALISHQRAWSARGLSVWSLGPRVSAGVGASGSSSVFQNTRRLIRVLPALEANLLPYSEASRRQALARYSVGVSDARYVDTTIYGKLSETRAFQELRILGDVREPWGGAWARVGWSQYLHDGSKRRFNFDFNVDWRIRSGLSYYVGGSYSLTRDQLHIAGTNLSDQDRLLRLRELQSGYGAYTAMGLSFTFGSVFNNVVNQRFPGA
jgi:hypothetical protein